jgi:hypothetical protein
MGEGFSLLPLENGMVRRGVDLSPEVGGVSKLVWVVEAVQIIFVVSGALTGQWLMILMWHIIIPVLRCIHKTSRSPWINLTEVWKWSISFSQFIWIVNIPKIVIRLVVFSNNSLLWLAWHVVIQVLIGINHTYR